MKSSVSRALWAWMLCGVAGAAAAAVSSSNSQVDAAALPQIRVVQPLLTGWRFKQSNDLHDVQREAYDDSSWQAVTVPHTWNRIGNEGVERSPQSNNVQAVGWYRLRFKAPFLTRSENRFFVEFDAVSTVADVWLNGHYLGRHEGAFARFRFDATAAINRAGDNLLIVKADNTRPQPGTATENVPPLSGDFFMFGGIYRGVSLIVTDPIHVDLLDFGGPGVYWNTPDVSAASAAVQITTRLVNDGPKPDNVQVESAVTDGNWKVVASSSAKVNAKAGSVSPVTADLTVPSPHLWQGTRDPYLYHVVVTISSRKGKILDKLIQPLGLRTLKFDPDKGFFLNGEHQYLKGVAMHQDRPVKGWAVSAADQVEDFDVLTDMGATAVRMAHYQHDQVSYDQADSRGIVAWAEVPLVNKVSYDGTPANAPFAANARQQLIELIRQNRNHPSIAVWSIANEIDLTATQVEGPSKPASLLRSLNALAKSEDPMRATTFADCCESNIPPHPEADARKVREPIVGIADTIGYNRYFGWYTGHFADFGPMLDLAHARHPQTPISVSEYGAGAALTQHTDDPLGGPINPHGRPHPEEYQNLYHEQSWSALSQRHYLWGSFLWNMFDFASDSRREGDLTDINEKGLVTYDRKTRKDAFFFYRANWSAQPTLHLVGRRYTDRAYGVLDVKAYSNAPQAALSVNGKDLGTTACSDGICLWRAVHLDTGSNALRATANIGGTSLSDEIRWTFSGSPDVVRIKAGDITGYVSGAQERYGSDMYFDGGEGKGVDAPDTPKEKRVAVSAADARLYDSYREGEFVYRIPVPNGRYRVTLRFLEPSAEAAGQRVFNVEVDNKPTLKAFDVFTAAGGKLKAVDREFNVKVRDGVLTLGFHPVKGKALVSAIAIAPVK